MSLLKKLIKNHNGYQFASQFSLATGDWNTIISFYNYYEQVFPNKNIDVRLITIFHDSEGNEIKHHEELVKAGASTQINTRELGVKTTGLVAVAAVVEADLKKLSEGRFKVREKITTGFYITWEKDDCFRDIMHEWEGVVEKVSSVKTHHVGVKYSSNTKKYGCIVSNPNLSSNKNTNDLLTLR